MEALSRRQQLCDSQRLAASYFFILFLVSACVYVCVYVCVCLCAYYSFRLLGDEKGGARGSRHGRCAARRGGISMLGDEELTNIFGPGRLTTSMARGSPSAGALALV